MTCSQKHVEFVRESMKNKSIDSINGIDGNAKAILNEKGYDQAYHLLGQFLVLDKNPDIFICWLQTQVPSMKPEQMGKCVDCLIEWSEKNL